jgi:hypothetical protein
MNGAPMQNPLFSALNWYVGADCNPGASDGKPANRVAPATGKRQLTGGVAARFTLDCVVDAHASLESNPDGKVLILPQSAQGASGAVGR